MVAAAAAMLAASCTGGPIPPGHSFLADGLCLRQGQWPRLLSTVTAFGRRNGLEAHGGIEPGPQGPDLNVALIRGLHQFGGDDLDLWITSDPFRPDRINFGVIAKNPLTPDDAMLTRRLLAEIAPLTCRPAPAAAQSRKTSPA